MPYKDPVIRKQKAKEASDRWRKNNPDRRREQNKAWVKNNPEKRKIIARNWARKNPHKARQHKKSEYSRDREKFRKKMRRFHLLSTYGLTLEQFEGMMLAQNGRCAICKTNDPGKRKSWSVDHNHATGAVRGLLCHRCNLGIGVMQDDPTRLRAAAAYLDLHLMEAGV